ncbi:MAG: PEP/pyruvate-binding domain-containing protein, partial [Woeseiaceae bacterium]
MIPVARIGRRHSAVGNKARSIQWLTKHQFDTPASWAIDAEQAAQWSSLPQLPTSVQESFMELFNTHRALAIRSSANVEDSESSSYAGQFDSVLNVAAVEDVLPA